MAVKGMKFDECCVGKTISHLAEPGPDNPFGCLLHPKVLPSLKILADAAKSQGFELKVYSGFRSFDTQMTIWNRKAAGARVILDANEEPIPYDSLSGWELAQAILRWSALPGASRHHWGTDVDIIDASACSEDYSVQLTQKEAAKDGIFGNFHQWLTHWLSENPECGFYKPYTKPVFANDPQFGIAPEPWHLSFAPAAQRFEEHFDLSYLYRLIEVSDILLKDTILEHLSEIYERFIRVGSMPNQVAHH
ncbi:M15 family metallopeptidase [Sessilibacter sp. MAH4]